LDHRVDFKTRNISEGFDEAGVDCVFLDVANSYDYLSQVRKVLKPGGYFGSILPTVNQVIKLLIALRQNNFAFIEVCDISIKHYKTEPSRFRPTDRMIAHTGYLIFARPVLITDGEIDRKLLEEVGMFSIADEDKYKTDQIDENNFSG
jgi:tRNA (adenine57-N1/adenine58-N1)-methyltransferase catalytic subunit